MYFHVYKKKLIIKIIVYIFITFTSFESWIIYEIYTVILILDFLYANLRDKELNFV